MLSGLPKLADRNFIVGFFVPTLLALLALIALFQDVEWVQPVSEAIWTEKKWEDITVFVLCVWVGAILLMLLNHLLYRMAEGYTGPMSWLGERRSTQWRQALLDRREQLVKLEESAAASADEKIAAGKEIDQFDIRLANHFPQEAFTTLPTRFGNVIRAFEGYAPTVYGIDSIAAWPRLTAVMSKEYASATADARAEVDFFLNLFFLSLLFVPFAFGRFCYDVYNEGWVWWSSTRCVYAAWLCAGLLLARGFYEGAVWRAVAWGTLVKGAFDVYLPPLANALGYQLPPTFKERQEFWRSVSLMMLYFKPMEPSLFPLAATTQNEKKAEPKPASEKTSTDADDTDTDDEHD